MNIILEDKNIKKLAKKQATLSTFVCAGIYTSSKIISRKATE